MIITSYFILPSVAAPHDGSALPGSPRRETNAVVVADHTATRHLGVVVLEERSDLTQGRFAEPPLFLAICRVSATVFEAFAA